jgi:hypothetical protein
MKGAISSSNPGFLQLDDPGVDLVLARRIPQIQTDSPSTESFRLFRARHREWLL